MTIFIGADHRGFDLKNKLMEYLQEKNIRIEDMGDYEYVANDDYIDYAQKVAQAVLQKPSEYVGIVICGSGIGVAMAANRYHGIRCAQAFSPDQIRHGRENDHVNVLSLAADYTDFETAKKIVETFLNTPPNLEEKYLRRVHKLDQT